MSETSPDALRPLLRSLRDAFPTGIDLDYFSLVGLPPTARVLSDAELSRFKSLSAAIEFLIEHDAIKADRFNDGREAYFWNVRLTGRGYSLLEQHGALLDETDFRETLVALSGNNDSPHGARSD